VVTPYVMPAFYRMNISNWKSARILSAMTSAAQNVAEIILNHPQIKKIQYEINPQQII